RIWGWAEVDTGVVLLRRRAGPCATGGAFLTLADEPVAIRVLGAFSTVGYGCPSAAAVVGRETMRAGRAAETLSSGTFTSAASVAGAPLPPAIRRSGSRRAVACASLRAGTGKCPEPHTQSDNDSHLDGLHGGQPYRLSLRHRPPK